MNMKRFLLSILCCLLAVVSGFAEEVKYTVSTASSVSVSGTAPEGSSATFKNTYTNNKVQLTSGNSMTLTLSGFAGNKITGIKLSMKSNQSGGAGNFSATVGATEISSISSAKFNAAQWNGSWSTSYVDINPNVTETEVKDSENVVITIAATANSLYCQSFTITYEPISGGDTGGEEPETPDPEVPGTPENVEGGTVTFTASKNGYSNPTVVEEVKMGDYVTVDFNTGTNPNNNSPTYYSSGTAIRCYGGNTFTITSTAGNITEIVLTYGTGGNSNEITTNVGTFTTNTWTGSSKSVKFTISGSTGNRRIAGISVTYEGTNSGTPEVENVQAPVISCNKEEYAVGEEAIVTITTTTEGATIYYSLDGSEPTTVYVDAIPLNETTIVKAIAKKEGANNSPVTEKTIVFKEFVTLVNATVAEAIAAYKSEDKIAPNATIVGYIVGAINGNNISGANFEGDWSTNSNILLADNADETNIENCLLVQLPSGNVRSALNLVDNPDNHKKKVILTGSVEAYFTVAGLKNTSAYTFIEETWGSLYLLNAIDIPGDVKAYIVTGVGSDYVSLTQITGALPANTGIIYYGAWTPNLSAVVVNEEANVTGNLLKGTATATLIEEEAFVLAKVDGEVGFYKAQMNKQDGNAFLNNANKAYLPASALTASMQGASGFKFRFDNQTTGIEGAPALNTAKAIYDLSGRKVNNATAPGLYIINGKKVMVK